MKTRRLSNRVPKGVVALAIAVLIGYAGSGCDHSETPNDPFGAAVTLTGTTDEGSGIEGGALSNLTINEIDSRAGLTAEQREQMQTALNKLQAEMKERHDQMKGRRGGRGRFGGQTEDPPQECPEGEPPIQEFLIEASNILTPEQFVKLAELMTEKREQMMAERGERSGPGHGGPKGGMFGRGGPHGHGAGGDMEGIGERLADELDLTEAQLEQVREIIEARFEEAKEIREQVRTGAITREQARELQRAIRESGREQIEEILTDEQRTRMEELHQERREERIDRRIERLENRIEKHASFLEQVLDPSDAQMSQINVLLADAIESHTAILNQVKEGALDHDDAAEQLKDLREATAESIRALLTPEQQTVFDALRDIRPKGRGHGLR